MRERTTGTDKIHLILFSLISIFSCPLIGFSQKDFYTPKSLIIPVHTHQGELHTSLGFGGGYDANISYAFNNHMAVFATGTLNKGRYQRLCILEGKYKIHKDDYAVKGGIGYFTRVNNSRNKFNILETYIGYGNYKVDNYWYWPDDISLGYSYTKAKFWNIFWQVNLTKIYNRRSTTLALRLAYSKYKDLQFWDAPELYNTKSRYEKLRGVTIDPVISHSCHIKRFKINIQAGVSYPLSSAAVDQIDTYTFQNQTTTARVDNVKTKIGLFSLVGKISLQHNFDFKSNQ